LGTSNKLAVAHTRNELKQIYHVCQKNMYIMG